MVNPALTIHSLTRCTPAKPTEKLGLTHAGNAIIVSMIDSEVTNSYGETLSKLMHCLFIILVQLIYLWSKYALISKV